jgi:hypothetical protein
VRGNVGTFAIEDLRVKNMTANARGTIDHPGANVAQKAGLNRSILDQGWGQIERLLTYKAERSRRQVLRVPAPGSSQTCHHGDNLAAEQRESQALFRCQCAGGKGTPTPTRHTPSRNVQYGGWKGRRRTWSPSPPDGLRSVKTRQRRCRAPPDGTAPFTGGDFILEALPDPRGMRGARMCLRRSAALRPVGPAYPGFDALELAGVDDA